MSHLPLIPGFSFNTKIGQDYFGKKQNFGLMGKTCILIDKPDESNRPASLFSRGETPDLPTWIVFDKQILRFDAYFQQTLQEMRFGPTIVRPVKIMYFLEDGTMKLIEPPTDNSGLCQGTMVRRHRIPIPHTNNFYDVVHLNIGKEVDIYGKLFLIVDCDRFTRLFLNRLGIRVPDPIEIPESNVTCNKRQPKGKLPLRKYVDVQFLEFDRKVLRFTGYWDDRKSEKGVVHHLEIFYYLSDDTVEIKEHFRGKSIKPHGIVFLRRAPLPKELPEKLMINTRYQTACETYRPPDFAIGVPLNVYGRMVILTDCDHFTKEYYRVKYGINDFEPVLPPEPLNVLHHSTPPIQLPPWNGYGTFEDSAANCRTIVPKMAHPNFLQFFAKDKIGFDSRTLRFAGRLVSDVPIYNARQFIISYFLADDTLKIYEKNERNSGFEGGLFSKRAEAVLPGQNMYASNPPNVYTTQDMWVGNILVINEHTFKLVDTDEYTLRYMELHAAEFPKANIDIIMDKIRHCLSVENQYKEFVAKNMALINPENYLMQKYCFERALKEVMGDCLSEHEFLTVARYFAYDEEQSKPTREFIRSKVYLVLYRNLWQNNDRLLEHLRYLDTNYSLLLPRKKLRQGLKACNFPLPEDLLDSMIDVIKVNGDGLYFYDDLMDFLNFKLKPAKCLMSIPAKSTKDVQCAKFGETKEATKHALIEWDVFIKHLNLEETLKENP